VNLHRCVKNISCYFIQLHLYFHISPLCLCASAGYITYRISPLCLCASAGYITYRISPLCLCASAGTITYRISPPDPNTSAITETPSGITATFASLPTISPAISSASSIVLAVFRCIASSIA